MAELAARGHAPHEAWRRPLPAQEVTLGRLDTHSLWSVPWDKQISKLHAALLWQGEKLRVRRLPQGKNEIFFHGEPCDEFTLGPGEEFVIGETTFTLENGAQDPPTPDSELTCSSRELRQVEDLDTAERLEVLYALPGVIRDSPSDQELESRVVDVLLRGLPRAEVAAVVRLEPGTSSADVKVEVGCWKSRSRQAENFRPSGRLIFDAIRQRRQSLMHIWHAAGPRNYTVDPSYGWALCVPLADEPVPDWGLYVAGRMPLEGLPIEGSGDHALPKSDLKFADLVAEIFGSLRQVLDLQRRQALLARFLSRPVLMALADKDLDEVLRPREVEVTVLFCDLRGSCHLAEEGRHELGQLWSRVSAALNIMASSIIDQDGVIGDFQGDSAMGFWGWPLGSEDKVERAARAALNIRRRFTQAAREPGNPLAGLACGLGLATGLAIAGKLGTPDQFKVGVFGPTVNLASRLETMTRIFGASILLDEASSERLLRGNNSYWARCRRLARVQPYGMTTVLTVSELLPAKVEPGTISEGNRKDYEAALEAFQTGRWTDAERLLLRLPGDGPAQVLQATMKRHRYTPPENWEGVLVMDTK